MIDMTCPQCKSEVQIDDGFKGGICRCFQCGTLMTVPDDPKKSTPQKLTRPEVPQSETAAPASEQTYSTSSGKKIKLSNKQLAKTPVAVRRTKHIRSMVFLMTGVISLVLVGGVVGLGFFLFYKPAPPTTGDIYKTVFEITENPYTYTQPNFMGLPVTDRTILLIDSSSSMRNYLDLAKQAALRSIASLSTQSVAVLFWAEAGPILIPEKLTPAAELDMTVLTEKLDEVYATGTAAVLPAIKVALNEKPKQMTIVTRELPDDATLDQMQADLKSAGVQLLIVHIEGDDTAPDALKAKAASEATGGKYVALSAGRLTRWYEAYLDQKAQQETDAEKVSDSPTP